MKAHVVPPPVLYVNNVDETRVEMDNECVHVVPTPPAPIPHNILDTLCLY